MVQTSFHVLMNYTAGAGLGHRGAPIAIHGSKWPSVAQRGRGLKWP